MPRNDNKTLDAQVSSFDKGNIADVIREIEKSENFRLIISEIGKKKYGIVGVLDSRKVPVACVEQSGDLYLARFGIIPSRDYEKNEKARQQAESMINYLKNLFKKYS